jgi:probable HAF family extracellular repeat protein
VSDYLTRSVRRASGFVLAGYSYINSTPNPTGVPTPDPFIWTKEGGMTDLGTLGGTFGFPVGLNNRGQVIGQSNLAGDQNSDAFLWDGEKLIDMSTNGLGGNFIGGHANAINDAGWVAGAAAFPNHPFDAALWRNGVVTDLGVLPGDCASEALVLNSKGQVAGGSFSCDGIAEHAFLWEDGTMYDLTALIPRDSGAQMVEPNAINDRGEIATVGLPAGCAPADFNTCSQAYVLIPCDRDHSDKEGCKDEGEGTPVATEGNSSPIARPADAIRDSLTPEMLPALRARLARRHYIPGLL